jgi:hypothetical protein
MIWPLIFYSNDKFTHYLFNQKETYKLIDLYLQILIGRGFYGIFWFLFNLLFYSLFFAIISLIFKNRTIFALFTICVIDYIYLYSKITIDSPFDLNKRTHREVYKSIKYIIRYFAFAFSGFYFASIKLINKIYLFRKIFLFFSIFYIYIFIRYHLSFFQKISYIFIGISENIFILNVFIIFSLIPFDKINSPFLINFLDKITSYTGGIYYLHVRIGEKFRNWFNINNQRTFKGCLLIYFSCYCICFLANIIFKKNHMKYLFS